MKLHKIFLNIEYILTMFYIYATTFILSFHIILNYKLSLSLSLSYIWIVIAVELSWYYIYNMKASRIPFGLILFYYPYFYWCREKFHITNGVSCLVWIIFFCKSSEICFLDPELSSKWLLSKKLIWHTEYMFKGWKIMTNKDTFIHNTFNWNITKSMISIFVHFR